ncbi:MULTISPECIES: hypothetical protein [unclassified Microcoleus]|uniref:hypothetical protein n=1 Tax=unclassified Microcoleus TaxID=2642155 RepID=UPI002FCFFFF1
MGKSLLFGQQTKAKTPASAPNTVANLYGFRIKFKQRMGLLYTVYFPFGEYCI